MPCKLLYEKCTAIINVISFIGYNRAISVIDYIRALSFSKAKMLGMHTLLAYKWNPFPAMKVGAG
jgi:hypothetical protein